LVDIHTGVSMGWSRQTLEGKIERDQLSAGADITFAGQGQLQAAGLVTLVAGGSVKVDADTEVKGFEQGDKTYYVTDTETVQVVTGTTWVPSGVVQVPKMVWTTTMSTEQVGSELALVGNAYDSMAITLSQLGYYNAKQGKFVEVLIEGIDYQTSWWIGSGPAMGKRAMRIGRPIRMSEPKGLRSSTMPSAGRC